MDLFGFEPDPRQQSASEALIVAFDFETTGLYAESDRVIEIGAVKSKNGNILDEYSTLVDPGMVVPSDASRISGITTEMLKGQPAFKAVADALMSFIKDAVLIAHNLPFDLGFLNQELGRIDKHPPENLGLDSCILARKTIPGMRSYSLSKLAAALDIDSGTSHRALDDAKTCLRLFEVCALRVGKDPEMGKLIDLGAHPDLHR